MSDDAAASFSYLAASIAEPLAVVAPQELARDVPPGM
jgi:hypothetical protein